MARRVANYFKLMPVITSNVKTRVLPDGSRVSKLLKSDELQRYNFKDATTITEAVQRGLRVSSNGPMLGYRKEQPDGTRPYVWMTHKEVIDTSFNVTAGLSKLGTKPGQETFIGIYASNRPEWVITELAAFNNRNVVVPLNDTLGRDTRSFIINQADIETVVCDKEDKALSLLEDMSLTPKVEHIVVMDQFGDQLKQKASSLGVSVHSFDDIISLGQGVDTSTLQAPSPDDLCVLCYTSGTTGHPKGAMLTHSVFIASSTIFQTCTRPNITLDHEDTCMSYLPLAHVYELLSQCYYYSIGAKVGFFSGNIRMLGDDMKALRPTIVPVVPRILNALYDKALAEANSSPFKKSMFNLALAYKSFEMNRGIVRNDSIFDELVFKRVREELGGRVRFMSTGSAPITGRVLNFARAAFGCIIIEGYGQTECGATCASTCASDMTTEHVGVPNVCNAIKLADVPELGYFARDQAGEICIRGHNVFKGYYNDEEKTKETLDEDGWLHTGDIGRWTQSGTLKIVDRKKHIFKLQQGEYIAPEKIEAVYGHSRFVHQVIVHGDSLKTCIIAIVVPEEQQLRSVAKDLKLGLDDALLEDLCLNEKLREVVLADIVANGRKGGLNSLELIKDVYLSPEPFTAENGLATATMKCKRHNIQKRFEDELKQMYAAL